MKRSKPNRICTSCRKVYYRVNKMSVWTRINPGHRLGWWKQEAKLCIDCCKAQMAQRLMTVAHVRLIEPPRKLKQVN